MSDVLTRARLVFWDFDGVIKESVAIKTNAFRQLFSRFGSGIADRIQDHHLANGGMSRFEKIPAYLGWAKQPVTKETVDEYCQQFSQLVRKCIIDAPWVPGVEQYLRINRYRQKFVLITATPQQEIEYILQSIDLHFCFSAIYGTPTKKVDAIRQVLSCSHGLSALECLMVGDAMVDLEASRRNKVPFLLRQHVDNQRIFHDYTGAFVKDFSGL